MFTHRKSSASCSCSATSSGSLFRGWFCPGNKNLRGGSLKMKFTQFIKNLHKEESGQDLVEYALVLIAVATAAVGGSATLAADFVTWMGTLSATINGKLS